MSRAPNNMGIVGRACMLPVLLLLALRAAAADPPLKLLGEWEKAGTAKLECPVDLAVDAAGRVFVLDQARAPRIHVFAADGAFEKSFLLERSKLPGGLALGANGNIYVTDLDRDTVLTYAPDGGFLTLWGGAGETEGRLANPRDIVVDAVGDIWVTDEGNRRIVKFAATDHHVLQTITFRGRSYANAIALLPDGRLAGLMTEHPGRLVFIWNTDGSVAGSSCFWGYLPKAMGLAAMPNGKLLGSCFLSSLVEIDTDTVADNKRHPPKILFGNPETLPHQVFAAVALNPKTGDIYLADKYGGKILRLAGGQE